MDLQATSHLETLLRLVYSPQPFIAASSGGKTTSCLEEQEWQHIPFGWIDYYWVAVEECAPMEEGIPSSLVMEMENDRCSLIDSNYVLRFNLEHV